MEKEEYKNDKDTDKKTIISQYVLENLLDIDIEKVKDPEKIVSSLRDEIARHNYYYYIKDNPIISDHQYDMLLRNLSMLEKKYPELIIEDSPTQRIGAPLEGGFSTVEHGERMLSLQDALKDF
ncbi:unnamed protein product [marine sediment metagenome]|uniref:Uncharacterized protein n=1 Tax=marine sediment metagenome TaxID=412755 RepID=X1PCA6_9ZZZZ